MKGTTVVHSYTYTICSVFFQFPFHGQFNLQQMLVERTFVFVWFSVPTSWLDREMMGKQRDCVVSGSLEKKDFASGRMLAVVGECSVPYDIDNVRKRLMYHTLEVGSAPEVCDGIFMVTMVFLMNKVLMLH